MYEKTSNNNESIKNFINKMEQISYLHKRGILYCESRDVWLEQCYHKNIVYYSDRLKDMILNHKVLNVTFYDDIYFAIIESYIEITGYVPKPMFEQNTKWLMILDRNLRCDSRQKYALIRLFVKCIRNIADPVILDVDDIFELDEYGLLNN